MLGEQFAIDLEILGNVIRIAGVPVFIVGLV